MCSGLALADSDPAVQLVLDPSEAEQALRIVHKEAAHQTATPDEWRKLFDTVPYQWLKARESSMGRPFTDQEFKSFLLSPASLAREGEWAQTLGEMKRADLAALARVVLAWLPDGAKIQARVFPEIKPRANSFVWVKPENGPAIFLYMEKQSQSKFENTVAHECHHIGLDSLEKQQEQMMAQLPERVRKAIHWAGGFGEGEAMLAATGSADRHPHWEDDAVARARWDADLMHFNTDLASVQLLLTDILDGRLESDAAITKRAAPFWGDQGAWYTVGYEMAVLVERQFGREAFTQALLDPRKLLLYYNEIARKANAEGATLALWSSDLLTRLQAANPAGH